MALLVSWWRARREEKQSARALYEICRACARQEAFYQAGVSDDVQGRFEMLAVHLWLVLHHLRRLGEASLSKRLTAVFFSEMDAAMRESGVGDMSVPRRIKITAQALYGRLKAYDAALAQQTLETALRQNIGVGVGRSRSADALAALSAYLLASHELMAQLSAAQFRHPNGLFAKCPSYI